MDGLTSANRRINFLDDLDADPDLEPTLGEVCSPAEADECETDVDAEPSFGSFDRMINQEGAWARIWRHESIANSIARTTNRRSGGPKMGKPAVDDREVDHV